MRKIRIRVAYATAARQRDWELEISENFSLGEALELIEIAGDCCEAFGEEAAIGVWGKARTPDYRLRDGDRIEIYRPLRADPKDARRRKAGHTSKM